VSPGATVEAWLYVAGLQGLFLAVQGIPEARRKSFVYSVVAIVAVLAGEGLWQSRSLHPYWLYGIVPVPLPSGFETATFGPYLNRNHFATVMAMGCGLSAGLASSLVRERGGLVALLSQPTSMAKSILASGASLFFAVTAMASGSRSGALAAIVAGGWLAMRTVGKTPFIAAMSAGMAALALGGAAAIERLQRLDVFTSRLKPWMDMTTLFRFFPALGSGFGTFAVTYWPYQRNVTYEFWQHAHNDYLQLTIEGGLVGVLVLGFVARSLFRASTGTPELREALLGASGAFAVQAAFDLPSHVPANAAILVCIVALTTTGRRR
jgi:O-antigen ligase